MLAAMRRHLAAALVIAAVPAAALAAEPPRAVNLDGDPELETVLDRDVTCYGDGEQHSPPCGKDEAREAQVTIVDTCAGVQRRFDLFHTPQSMVTKLKVLEADGEPSRPELLVDGRSGAAGYIGEVAVVRLGGTPTCARPVFLFRHPGPRARTRKPRGAFRSTTGFVTAHNYRKRYRGRELRLKQSWYRGSDAGCCPTWISSRYFRYSRGRDRYVPYRSKIRRLRHAG